MPVNGKSRTALTLVPLTDVTCPWTERPVATSPDTTPDTSPDSPAESSIRRPPDPEAPASFRQRMRTTPGLSTVWKVGVFVAGLLFILLGMALAVLPGPLTIPPVLIGLWIWSTEFAWANRLFRNFQTKAKQAWAHAKVHPISSALITLGGLAAAGVAIWAVTHYQLVDRARELVGL